MHWETCCGLWPKILMCSRSTGQGLFLQRFQNLKVHHASTRERCEHPCEQNALKKQVACEQRANVVRAVRTFHPNSTRGLNFTMLPKFARNLHIRTSDRKIARVCSETCTLYFLTENHPSLPWNLHIGFSVWISPEFAQKPARFRLGLTRKLLLFALT